MFEIGISTTTIVFRGSGPREIGYDWKYSNEGAGWLRSFC